MSESLQVFGVTCNHCGAPLEVPQQTRFLTCQYCGMRLEVHQSGGAVYTEVLAAIDARTQQIAQDVEIIKLQNEVDQLDREWSIASQDYAVTDKYGSTSLPNKRDSFVRGFGLVFLLVFVIAWIVGAASMEAPIIFPIFGVGMLIMIIAIAVTVTKKENDYHAARLQYKRRRQRLLDSLGERTQ